jgi:hypothetical protein
MGGTRVIISIENLDPIIVYDLKRKRSPNTKPMNPDSVSQIQLSIEASVGRSKPRRIKLKRLRKIKPITSLSILTAIDPMRWPAASNARDVTVQKTATSNAENSPRWLLKNVINPNFKKEAVKKVRYFYPPSPPSGGVKTCRILISPPWGI